MSELKMSEDTKFITESFSRNFSAYKAESLVIYGIGVMTKAVVETFPDFNIVGLMDETRTGENVYGKPLLTYDDVIHLKAKRIIIIATANNTNIIFNRIARFCKKNEITVYSIDGNVLPILHSKNKTFEKYSKVSLDVLKRKIDEADIVSFDVFDTLIMRKVLFPRDIFHIIAKRTNIPDFYTARIKAETQLHIEHNLSLIYDGVAAILSLNYTERAELMNIEIAVEKEFITIRESVVEAFLYATHRNKKVYLVSDMYLPAELMREILTEKGIEVSLEKTIVSCDYNVSKSNGLFNVLRAKAGDGRILHIGDNKTVDIEAAVQYGIDDTFQLYSAYDMLSDFKMAELLTYTDKLADRILIGKFIANELNDPFLFQRTNGKLEILDNYKLGESFFAPLIFTYVVWLAEQVKKEKYDYIFCSARDGWLIKKIIEKHPHLSPLFPKLVYFYTSRKVAMRCLLSDDASILTILQLKHAGTLEDILLRNFCLTNDEILSLNCSLTDEEYILKHKESILAHAETTKTRHIAYINGLGIKRNAKIGYIDFTSSGTTQLGLTKISDYTIKGLYFLRLIGREFINEKNSLDIDSCYEKKSFYSFSSKLLNYYTEVENILTSYEATVDDFNEDGTPLFTEEKRSLEFLCDLEEIHISIIDYCLNADVDLFTDYSREVAELLFFCMHEEFSVTKARYFENNFVYDDVPNRVWKIFGQNADKAVV